MSSSKNKKYLSEDEVDQNQKFAAEEKARQVMERLKKLSLKLALAESCTAGIISGFLADIEGASSVLWGSFVCYTQEAKVSMLGLDNSALRADGLICGKTARAMAEGALNKSGADIAASVTGLAGPQGDGRNPVGTVWVSAVLRGSETERQKTLVKEFHFNGARNFIRYQAAAAVLDEILNILPAI